MTAHVIIIKGSRRITAHAQEHFQKPAWRLQLHHAEKKPHVTTMEKQPHLLWTNAPSKLIPGQMNPVHLAKNWSHVLVLFIIIYSTLVRLVDVSWV